MQYASGGDLWSLIKKKGKFREPELKFYLVEIVIALKYLHYNNVIYYDLKEDNILLRNDGHILLADFGLS